ncbi:hypothetical protein [Nonomuraea sp. NPDC003201]
MSDVVFTAPVVDDLRRIGPDAVPKILKKNLLPRHYQSFGTGDPALWAGSSSNHWSTAGECEFWSLHSA